MDADLSIGKSLAKLPKYDGARGAGFGAFTRGKTRPYSSTDNSAYISGMVTTHRVWEIIAIEAPVEVSPP